MVGYVPPAACRRRSGRHAPLESGCRSASCVHKHNQVQTGCQTPHTQLEQNCWCPHLIGLFSFLTGLLLFDHLRLKQKLTLVWVSNSSVAIQLHKHACIGVMVNFMLKTGGIESLTACDGLCSALPALGCGVALGCGFFSCLCSGCLCAPGCDSFSCLGCGFASCPGCDCGCASSSQIYKSQSKPG